MKAIKKILEKPKGAALSLLFCSVIGILLILLSHSFTPTVKKSDEAYFTYAEYLEEKTQNVIESITGKNTARVMITFKNSSITQTANEEKTSVFSTGFENSAGTYSALPLPEVAGVMIVCKSVTNPDDLEIIKKAVATCLDIKTGKIYIIGGTEQ